MPYFVGLDPPPEVRDWLALQASELRKAWTRAGALEDSLRRIRWVDPRDYHLTLSYLGQVPESLLPSVRLLLTQIARRHVPPELRIVGWGGFPEALSAQVLWAGVVARSGTDELSCLAQECVREFSSIPGLELSRSKAFVGHMTLARLEPPAPIPQADGLGGPDGARFIARDLVLYRSAGSGTRYERMLRAPFQ